MSAAITREQRRQLERDNAKQPGHLVEVQRSEWQSDSPAGIQRCWRSRNFLVQLWAAPAPAVGRLSICRTTVMGERWKDEITWDELQSIKAQAGYAFTWAIEIYPSCLEVVNVASLRHLWLLPEAPAFAWRRS